MNSFGKIFRVSIFGESHGSAIGVLLDGVPPGISLLIEDFETDLKRRQGGTKIGATPRKESDIPKLLSGVFNETTTGMPVLIQIENENIDSSAYEKLKNTPRPGHSDFVAYQKYEGFNDFRGGGHFSGRLTAAIVAAGVVAKKIISPIEIRSEILEVGGSKNIAAAVKQAVETEDSVGGLIECRVENAPVGLGEPFFDSVESLISHAVFSIPAIKGIQFGAGFSAANKSGSQMNDEILNLSGKTKTNNSGGINGGITNGNEIYFSVAVKPTSSIKKRAKTVDLNTGENVDISVEGRHDACIALRVPPVLEAMTAIVLADLVLIENRTNQTRN